MLDVNGANHQRSAYNQGLSKFRVSVVCLVEAGNRINSFRKIEFLKSRY
ncbi:hypothetical protein BLL52_3564 [Rhodoferax antarcticus ANT.BR]|uniref:Uncharacterized protein n=1 Tax=Rhodoferax antarcticus ANT.BR TaxID=1111071 RepID=A0A1Q8YBS2_9BURK|nr:hypothetical protein BLL52_3564 [Rhodoferax antarcticus ANT.BR]